MRLCLSMMTIIFPSDMNMLQYATGKTGIFRCRWMVPKAKSLTKVCHRLHIHTISLEVIVVPDFFAQTENTQNRQVTPTGAREGPFSSCKCPSSESRVGGGEPDFSHCWHSSSLEKCHRGLVALPAAPQSSSIMSSLHSSPSSHLNHYL